MTIKQGRIMRNNYNFVNFTNKINKSNIHGCYMDGICVGERKLISSS
jgi:hypothetical protein